MPKRFLFISPLLALSLFLVGFTPFTAVKNVCPACTTGPRFDTVVLLSGARVACNVVAQNGDYYVVERFGELRMIKKTNVSSLEWRDAGPRKLASGDQILLNTGIALHGTIVERQKGRFFVIQLGTQRHVVWDALIAKVYQKGVAVPLK